MGIFIKLILLILFHFILTKWWNTLTRKVSFLFKKCQPQLQNRPCSVLDSILPGPTERRSSSHLWRPSRQSRLLQPIASANCPCWRSDVKRDQMTCIRNKIKLAIWEKRECLTHRTALNQPRGAVFVVAFPEKCRTVSFVVAVPLASCNIITLHHQTW